MWLYRTQETVPRGWGGAGRWPVEGSDVPWPPCDLPPYVSLGVGEGEGRERVGSDAYERALLRVRRRPA